MRSSDLTSARYQVSPTLLHPWLSLGGTIPLYRKEKNLVGTEVWTLHRTSSSHSLTLILFNDDLKLNMYNKAEKYLTWE